MFGSGSLRWIVVAAATLGLAAAFGAASTISVLIGPFEAQYGWLAQRHPSPSPCLAWVRR